MHATPSANTNRVLLILAIGCIYIIWGTTHLALQVTVKTLPPLLSIGSRHFVAGILLMLVALRANRRPPTLRECINSAPLGLVTMGLCNGLVALVGSRIGAGTITCIFATGPLFILILNWFRDRGSRSRSREVLSVLAGLVGIGLLVGSQVEGLRTPETAWMLLLLFSTILWAASTLWTRDKLKASPILFNASLQMLWGGAASLLTAWLSGDASSFSWQSVSMESLLAYGYLIVFGSLAAVTAFNYVLLHKGAMVAASHSYANPVVALLVGHLFTGEQLPLPGWLGFGFILFAVVSATTGIPVQAIRMRMGRVFGLPLECKAG